MAVSIMRQGHGAVFHLRQLQIKTDNAATGGGKKRVRRRKEEERKMKDGALISLQRC